MQWNRRGPAGRPAGQDSRSGARQSWRRSAGAPERRSGTLTRTRSLVQIQYGPPGKRKKSSTSNRPWEPFRGPTVPRFVVDCDNRGRNFGRLRDGQRIRAGAGCSGMCDHDAPRPAAEARAIIVLRTSSN